MKQKALQNSRVICMFPKARTDYPDADHRSIMEGQQPSATLMATHIPSLIFIYVREQQVGVWSVVGGRRATPVGLRLDGYFRRIG